LGGLVLNEQKYVDFGLQLVNACENTYNQTLTGIGPEGFSWNTSSLPADQQEFYERAGFYITDSRYILRPEVIESFYYAFRATGDRVYQDVSGKPIAEFVLCIVLCTDKTLPSGRGMGLRRLMQPAESDQDSRKSTMSMPQTAVVSRTSRIHSYLPKS
jgi:hypothetical protein